MSFRANLNLDGNEFDVIKCDYTIERDVDSKGRPASNLYGGKIRITVESTDKVEMFQTMAAQFKPISGSVAYKKDDEDATMKELKWTNGYIVCLEEGMNIADENPMLVTITISAQKLELGDAIFEQNWPEMG